MVLGRDNEGKKYFFITIYREDTITLKISVVNAAPVALLGLVACVLGLIGTFYEPVFFVIVRFRTSLIALLNSNRDCHPLRGFLLANSWSIIPQTFSMMDRSGEPAGQSPFATKFTTLSRSQFCTRFELCLAVECPTPVWHFVVIEETLEQCNGWLKYLGDVVWGSERLLHLPAILQHQWTLDEDERQLAILGDATPHFHWMASVLGAGQ